MFSRRTRRISRKPCSSRPVSKALKSAVLLLVVAAVAAGSCWLTGRWMQRPKYHDAADYHLWVHQELKLTTAQEEVLHAAEHRFAEKRKHLTEIIRLANMELAEAITKDRANSPRVEAAVAKIHSAQGELQRETMAHVFEMQPHLSPEQYEKLLNFTANALYEAAK